MALAAKSPAHCHINDSARAPRDTSLGEFVVASAQPGLANIARYTTHRRKQTIKSCTGKTEVLAKQLGGQVVTPEVASNIISDGFQAGLLR